MSCALRVWEYTRQYMVGVEFEIHNLRTSVLFLFVILFFLASHLFNNFLDNIHAVAVLITNVHFLEEKHGRVVYNSTRK